MKLFSETCAKSSVLLSRQKLRQRGRLDIAERIPYDNYDAEVRDKRRIEFCESQLVFSKTLGSSLLLFTSSSSIFILSSIHFLHSLALRSPAIPIASYSRTLAIVHPSSPFHHNLPKQHSSTSRQVNKHQKRCRRVEFKLLHHSQPGIHSRADDLLWEASRTERIAQGFMKGLIGSVLARRSSKS